MRQSFWKVLIVVVAAVLVASATPAAAASTNLAVASQVTTANEFDGGSFTDTTSATIQSDGGVAFGGTVQREADDASASTTNRVGVVIEPETDLNEVTATLSSTATGATQAYLETTSGTVLDTATVSGAGDTVTFSASLNAGTQYRVVVDDNGDSFQVGYRDFTSYPYQSTLVDIVDGYESGYVTSNAFAFRSVTALSDTGSYTTPNQSVSDIEEVAINVTTVRDSDLTLYAEYWDGSTWITANQTTVTTTGNKTLGVAASASKWRVRASFTGTGGAPDAFISDVSWLFDSATPTASNIQPADGTKITQSTVNFSVDVSDADFGTAQGDEVRGTLYVNGSAVGSQNVTSNQTVSVTHSLSKGGNVSYHWELTDSYGDTTTTSTQTLTLPAELEIIDEENETLIDNATVRLKFYLENETDTRVVETTTSNGTVDFAALDLPADEPFIVTASADGYLSRRIYVPSLFEQQRVYLLNETATHRDIIFELRDFSGQYPESETVLLIQRSINGSYQTVQSDFFGATGEFTAQLAYNERHRLILLNTNTGERRALGPFTPLTDSRSVLKITQDGEIRVLDDAPIVRVAPSLETVPATASTELSVEIVEQATAISDWRITATYVNGSTSTELANISSSEASSPVSFTVDLSNRTAGSLWVNTTFTLVDGTTSTLNEQFSIRQYARNEHSLLNVVSGVTALIPAPDVALVTTLLALLTTVGLTVGIASSVSIPTEAVGTIAVASLMGFGVLGWISYQIPFVAGVTLLAAAGLRRGI